MKKTTTIVAALFAVACITAAFAQDKKDAHDKPAPTNPQFEKLKKLAGEWTGKASHGEMENQDMKVIYKLTANGSTVMETLFPGTEHEMITMYTMDGSELVLTHYCSMGNQPHMKAESSKDANTIKFTCNGHGGNMKSEKDMHMHSAVITFVDDSHLKSAWTMSTDGKPGDEAKFELTRKVG